MTPRWPALSWLKRLSGLSPWWLHRRSRLPGVNYVGGRLPNRRQTPAAGSALKGEFEGLRRLRVGQYQYLYRVIYEWQPNELVILVVRVGHRRDGLSLTGAGARYRCTTP